MLSNVLTELVWNTGVAVVCFLVWYYPMGLFRNAQYTGGLHPRGALVFLIVWAAFLFGSSLAHALIAGAPTAEAASALANVLAISKSTHLKFSQRLKAPADFALPVMYVFCGVLAPPSVMPGFWIFMYRVSPFTYLAGGFLSAAIGEAPVQCASDELLSVTPPGSQSCREYLDTYIEAAGGYVSNPAATDTCLYCPTRSTTEYLESVGIDYDNRWGDFGILWVFIVVNIAGAIGLYWLFRVPKRNSGP